MLADFVLYTDLNPELISFIKTKYSTMVFFYCSGGTIL